MATLDGGWRHNQSNDI